MSEYHGAIKRKMSDNIVPRGSYSINKNITLYFFAMDGNHGSSKIKRTDCGASDKANVSAEFHKVFLILSYMN